MTLFELAVSSNLDQNLKSEEFIPLFEITPCRELSSTANLVKLSLEY